ncbi:hypothetical protein KY359_02185 [Candidatus Woesearchaeota archaeon]|nr:hypothetical protein [Candidatus Woesearchaeota archaeon]
MLENRMKINRRTPRSRIVTASGCRATTLETILLYSRLIPEIGVFTTKSIGPAPKPGNHAPIYCAADADDYGELARSNAVGLANPGYEVFEEELAALRHDSPDLNGALLLGSVFGANLEEIVTVARALAPHLDAVEINFSCPHAKGYGFDTGTDAENMARIVHAVCRATGKDVFAKLSPNLGDAELGNIAKACVEAGAKGITVINTVGPIKTFLPGTDNPVLYNGVGGMSGPIVKARGLECVSRVRDAVGHVPVIIGMGGIFSGEDCRDYLEAGADLVGIGTAMEGFRSDHLAGYMRQLVLDMDEDTDTAGLLLPECVRLNYKQMRIDDIVEHSDDLRMFIFDDALDECAVPGQYVFLAVPGDGSHPTMEAPFSVPLDDPLTLAVRRYPSNGRDNHFTSRLWEKNIRDTLFVRGPYGVPFDQGGVLTLVGGGTGVAVLASIAARYPDHSAFIGARTRDELLFQDEFSPMDTFIATDDGSQGYHGFVTDLFDKRYTQGGVSSLVVCGPLPMMLRTVEIARAKGFPDRDIHVVLEPYMKCGVGICGSCSQYDGSISCTDGHIVTADRFMSAVKHGKVKRTPDGGWER